MGRRARPAEHGGRGATLTQSAIVYEELARSEAPMPANGLGILLAGPTIMTWGTQDQKERFLAPILTAEEIWCQGFSEPEAGSDSAALKTRDPERLAQAAALAAAAAADGGREVTGSAIQAHGGIGFTWEADVHWFYKRAQLDAALLGRSSRHRLTLSRIAAARIALGGRQPGDARAGALDLRETVAFVTGGSIGERRVTRPPSAGAGRPA